MSLSFSFTDFLIVAIIAISAGYAAWRGFLWETLSIFEWVAAAFACLYLGPYFLPLTGSLVGQSWLAGLLAYAGVFLAVFIPMAFMSHRLAQGVGDAQARVGHHQKQGQRAVEHQLGQGRRALAEQGRGAAFQGSERHGRSGSAVAWAPHPTCAPGG